MQYFRQLLRGVVPSLAAGLSQAMKGRRTSEFFSSACPNAIRSTPRTNRIPAASKLSVATSVP